MNYKKISFGVLLYYDRDTIILTSLARKPPNHPPTTPTTTPKLHLARGTNPQQN